MRRYTAVELSLILSACAIGEYYCQVCSGNVATVLGRPCPMFDALPDDCLSDLEFLGAA